MTHTEEHLKQVFALCDHDSDGVISIEDLQNSEEMRNFGELNELLRRLDPLGSGRVSCEAFVLGIQSFLGTQDTSSLLTKQTSQESRDEEGTASHSTSNHLQIHTGDPDGSFDGSDDTDVHVFETVSPAIPHNSSGQDTESPILGYDWHEEATDLKGLQRSVERLTKENRLLLSRQHQLVAENSRLKENLDVVEDSLQERNKRLHSEERERGKERQFLKRLKSESQLEKENLHLKLMNLLSDLEHSRKNEKDLKQELELSRKDLQSRDGLLEGAKGRLEASEEQWRRSEGQWDREREALRAENGDLLREVKELSRKEQSWREVEEVSSKRMSTTSIEDFSREVFSLNKEIDRLKAENVKLTVEQGKSLMSSSKVESLGAELETASRDELLASRKEAESANERLRAYIGTLLSAVMDKHPDLLEIRSS